MKKPIIILAIVATLGTYMWFNQYGSEPNNASFLRLPDFGSDQAIPANNQNISTLQDFNNAIVNIANTTNKAVVTVLTSQTVRTQPNPMQLFFGNGNMQPGEYTRQGLGSGVIVSKDGYILTNNHVIDGADSIRVRLFDDQDYAVKVIGRDPQTDVAILQLNDKKAASNYLSMGDSDALQIGELVIAIGSPLDDELAHTVTMGIVSGKGRPAGPTVVQDEQGRQVQIPSLAEYIQTDAAINPGNSGGALIDMNGRLVGINSAIATKTGGFQGIGFAIPINLAKQVMESLIKNGRVIRGFLGIVPQEITPTMAKALGLTTRGGVLVGDVSEDTPAEKYGLKEGDVILKMNNRRVRNAASFRVMVASLMPNQEVTFEVLRDGKERTIDVVLTERENDLSEVVNQGINNDDDAQSTNIVDWTALGFQAQEMTSQIADQFRLDRDLKGLVVTSVNRTAKVAQVLSPGDVIIRLGNDRVESMDDFKKVYKSLKESGKEVVLIRFVRGNAEMFGALELPK
jgi:serine protease Do